MSASIATRTRSTGAAGVARTRKRWPKLVVIGIVVLLGMLPLLLEDPMLGTLSYVAVFAIAAIGMVVVVGRAGQVSLAQPFFMGIGAYIAAYGGAALGTPLIVSLPVAIVVAGLVGWAVGWLAIRIGGVELAIMTLGLVVVGEYIFHEWRAVTGGESGTGVGDLGSGLFGVPFEQWGGLSRTQIMFWLVWAGVGVAAYICHQFLSQRTGRALVAVRDNVRAAESIGIDVRRYKVFAFAVSAMLGASAGVLFAALQQYVTPVDFGLDKALLLMAMVVVGGQDRIAGAIVGALVVYGGQLWLAQQADAPWLAPILKSTPLDAGLITAGDFNMLMTGVVIVLVLVFWPGGLAGGIAELWIRAVARRRTARNSSAEALASSADQTSATPRNATDPR